MTKESKQHFLSDTANLSVVFASAPQWTPLVIDYALLSGAENEALTEKLRRS